MANTGGSPIIRTFLVLFVACLLLTNLVVDARGNGHARRLGKGRGRGGGHRGRGGGHRGRGGGHRGPGRGPGGGAPRGGGGGGGPGVVYNVLNFGAKSDGRTSNELAFIRAWRAACDSNGPARLVIPPGNFVAGETVFRGPCAGQKPITIEIQGTLLASEDPSGYTGKAWISVERLQNVIVTGGGTINARGKNMWEYAGEGGSPLPTSLQFQSVAFSKMNNLNFVDSMGKHIKASDCHDIEFSRLRVTAPGNSPNTDGIHTSNATNIQIIDSIIGTGDDCVALGHGSNNVLVRGITCGPGHGISIGSLGKRPDELDMKGVTVINCTMIGTTNGARIKTFHGSKPMTATSITYQDIVLDRVQNPIIIDQHYQSKSKPQQSRVKLSDIHFKNFRGTTTSQVPVTLACSSAVPCQGVEISNVNLRPAGRAGILTSSCSNARASVTGLLGVGPLKCT